MKIPKEIADKMKQANELNNEIQKWMNENIYDFDEFDCSLMFWDIVSEPKGVEQLDGEYCDQRQLGEDWFVGEYYWKLEGESKYLRIHYEC